MRRALPALLALALLAPLPAMAGAPLLPDLRTVVPQHLNLVNEHQREILRFSNGIANTGPGDWRLRPEFPLADPSQAQLAIQELLDADRHVVSEQVVSQFEFHPAHNHWHIHGVALFEVRAALDDGTGGAFGDVVVNDRGAAQSLKTTFCLIDWYKLEGPSKTKDRIYFECNGAYQGIQAGWADQYHQATPGQELDLTGAPAGAYYLLSTANHEASFVENDLANNAAWVGFQLTRDSEGNAKVKILGHSPCAGALCGEDAPNR
ncbi:MAG TPA: lysyl oxidase family protein [Candidatus Thermoplasmatota archaeon]|nr:lysyl oxidase family protein [Candidatus Thermoplasmatota archaeon]